MPYPRLTDDGSTVTLDLHGATVDDAVRICRRTLQVARQRGRSGLKIIHGTSTSHTLSGPVTIKRALHRHLDEGTLGPGITTSWRSDTFLILSLELGSRSDRTPIRLSDVA